MCKKVAFSLSFLRTMQRMQTYRSIKYWISVTFFGCIVFLGVDCKIFYFISFIVLTVLRHFFKNSKLKLSLFFSTTHRNIAIYNLSFSVSHHCLISRDIFGWFKDVLIHSGCRHVCWESGDNYYCLTMS